MTPFATLHTTNHPRRAHPAVIRAALRSRARFTKQTQSIDPAGNTTDYGYDARGNLISVTDAKGNPVRRFDPNGLLVGTASGAVQASVMVVAVGASVSAGGIVGTDGKKCEVYQICFRFGGGMFAGVGLAGSLGANAGGTADSGGFSVGVGGDAALGAAGVGGQATIGVPSPTSGGVNRGSVGVGIGLSAGVDVCYTYVTNCTGCR